MINWGCDQKTLISLIKRDPIAPLEIISMGQSGFILKMNGLRIAIDLVVSDLLYAGSNTSRRQIPPPFPASMCPPIDAFLVSHDHADHNDYEFLSKRLEADPSVILMAPEVVRRQYGSSRFDLPFVHPVPVAHESYATDGEGNPLAYGFIIDTPVGSIFHSGDAVVTDRLVNELKIAERSWIMMMLPINGRGKPGVVGNMNIPEAIALAKEFKTTYLVPTHWDLFRENGADIDDFVERARTAGQQYLIQHPGEVWDFA